MTPRVNFNVSACPHPQPPARRLPKVQLFYRRPNYRPNAVVFRRPDPRSTRRLCRLELSRIARELPRRAA